MVLSQTYLELVNIFRLTYVQAWEIPYDVDDHFAKVSLIGAQLDVFDGPASPTGCMNAQN